MLKTVSGSADWIDYQGCEPSDKCCNPLFRVWAYSHALFTPHLCHMGCCSQILGKFCVCLLTYHASNPQEVNKTVNAQGVKSKEKEAKMLAAM